MTDDDYTHKHTQIELLANLIDLSMEAVMELVESQSILINEVSDILPPEGVDLLKCSEQLENAIKKNEKLGLLLKPESEYYN